MRPWNYCPQCGGDIRQQHGGIVLAPTDAEMAAARRPATLRQKPQAARRKPGPAKGAPLTAKRKAALRKAWAALAKKRRAAKLAAKAGSGSLRRAS